MMIVIAIVLILVAMAMPRISPMLHAGHETIVEERMRTLTNELSAYRMDCGGFPANLAALKLSPGKGCSKNIAAGSVPTTVPGYRLSYTPTDLGKDGLYSAYRLSVVPSSAGSAGKDSYLTDQTGIIRVQRGGPATGSNPTLVP
jgi:type II secretory pathway pseudopilin PulG